MSTEEPEARDPVGVAAALIHDVGVAAQFARRYRGLATALAEPAFDRVLAIGSEVRRAARGQDSGRAMATAIAELRELQARCESAIADFRTSRAYQEALSSFRAGEAGRTAGLAPAIFTDVAAYEPTGALYWAVPLGGGRSAPHFIPPAACAARILTVATDGIKGPAGPPDLGGDDEINPVRLSEDRDGSESPIALAFAPPDLPAALCTVEGTGVVLFYAERLRAKFTIACVADVDDEWWRIRPDAYRSYVDDLEAALAVEGLTVARGS